MSPTNHPSLLGLPRELRLLIYGYIRRLDVNWLVLESFHDEHDGDGYKATPVRSDPLPCIPWLALTSTCRTIAHELGSSLWPPKPEHVSAGAHKQAPDLTASRTYALDVELIGSEQVGQVGWQKIPCAPADARTLHVTIHCDAADTEGCLWGCGGPMPVVRSLYQLLNLFLHCGPRLDATLVLQKPVCLLELVIEVKEARKVLGHLDEGYTVYDEDFVRTKPSEIYEQIVSFLWQFEETGLLFEYVERLRVVGSGAASERQVRQMDGAGVPALWEGYGFEWGVHF